MLAKKEMEKKTQAAIKCEEPEVSTTEAHKAAPEAKTAPVAKPHVEEPKKE